jgi:hypothetical protein
LGLLLEPVSRCRVDFAAKEGKMAETAVKPPVRPIAIAQHPLYAMFLPVPVMCFIGVLLTDITYVKSDGNPIWLAFSSWLLLAGLLFGAIGRNCAADRFHPKRTPIRNWLDAPAAILRGAHRGAIQRLYPRT